MESLAQFLGVQDPRPEADRPQTDFEQLADISDPKEFCARVLASREFRQYLMNGIVLGDIPPMILARMMDHGWGKPPERVEHTGKDGKAIVTEIRRVVVHVSEPELKQESYTTH